MHSNSPPPDPHVDIGTLSRVFKNTLTSYKILWFLAILEEFRTKTPTQIPYARLVKRMLRKSDKLVRVYRLDCGTTDKMADHINEIGRCAQNHGRQIDLYEKGRESHNIFWHQVDEGLLRTTKAYKHLIKYVPHRFLFPFIPTSHTAGIGADDYRRTKLVRELFSTQSRRNYGVTPPYFLNEEHKNLEITPPWATYFTRNWRILEEWTFWKYARYLQKHNPNDPGLVAKVADSSDRNLSKQHKIWDQVLHRHPGKLLCPYSRKAVSATDYSLDHFIPHSYVVNNMMWNLVPTSKEVNSKKNDRLPDMDKHFKEFAASQWFTVEFLLEHSNDTKCANCLAEYERDVLHGKKLLASNARQDLFAKELNSVIGNLHAAASHRGFAPFPHMDLAQ